MAYHISISPFSLRQRSTACSAVVTKSSDLESTTWCPSLVKSIRRYETPWLMSHRLAKPRRTPSMIASRYTNGASSESSKPFRNHTERSSSTGESRRRTTA
jgi:hypothetical protein